MEDEKDKQIEEIEEIKKLLEELNASSERIVRFLDIIHQQLAELLYLIKHGACR